MEKLSLFRASSFINEFSSRAKERGRSYSMEGYVFNVDVQCESSPVDPTGFVRASATCWASMRKKVKHGVMVFMKTAPSYKLIKCECECQAGEGERCSHVCGLLYYLAAHAAFLREEAASAVATPSPTSVPRQWGIPKRRIAPETPVSKLNFAKVKEGQPFSTVKDVSSVVDPRTEAHREVTLEAATAVYSKMEAAGNTAGNCLMLHYATPERVVECAKGIFFRPTLHGTAFESRRPKPVMFPAYLASFFEDIRTQMPSSPVSREAIYSAVTALMGALGSVDRSLVEEATWRQADTEDWY